MPTITHPAGYSDSDQVNSLDRGTREGGPLGQQTRSSDNGAPHPGEASGPRPYMITAQTWHGYKWGHHQRPTLSGLLGAAGLQCHLRRIPRIERPHHLLGEYFFWIFPWVSPQPPSASNNFFWVPLRDFPLCEWVYVIWNITLVCQHAVIRVIRLVKWTCSAVINVIRVLTGLGIVPVLNGFLLFGLALPQNKAYLNLSLIQISICTSMTADTKTPLLVSHSLLLLLLRPLRHDK